MKIVKMLEDIAELDFKIARIKNGTDEATNKKKEDFLKAFYKNFNTEKALNDIITSIKINK